MGQPTQITIVSRNELHREGLKRLIVGSGFSAVCLSPRAAECASTDHDDPHRLFLFDYDGDVASLASARALRARFVHSRIALLAHDFSLSFIKDGLAAGFNGFLARDMGFSALLQSLRLVLAGEKVLPTRSIDHLIGTDAPIVPADWSEACDQQHLSRREIGILHCLIDGDANKVISRRLNIAEPTVKVHIKAILRKLKVENRTQAAVWAVSRRSPPGASLQ